MKYGVMVNGELLSGSFASPSEASEHLFQWVQDNPAKLRGVDSKDIQIVELKVIGHLKINW